MLGHNAFLKTVTNQLDFIVLISNVLDLVFTILVPDESVEAQGLQVSRDLVRCIRALRALRMLRVANKFAVMRNMLFLLGNIQFSLMVSVAINSIFLVASALIAQELWSASLHFGCYSTQHGVREWPPRKCDPTLSELYVSGGGFFGGLHGRVCPDGFACIAGLEGNLEDPAVVAALEGGAKAPQGLSVSFANFRDASSTVLTALMLDTWMLMLSQTVEAVGPSAVIFAVAILILGPFFTQQLFVATMAVQLEKLHDRGSVDVAKRIINQWFHVIQFRAFAKWKAHWFEKQNFASKVVRSRIVQHHNAMHLVALRFLNRDMIPAWNAWYSFAESEREIRHHRMLTSQKKSKDGNGDTQDENKSHISSVTARSSKTRSRIVSRYGKHLTGNQLAMAALKHLAESIALERFVAGMVVATVLLMSLQGSCSSKLGRMLGCSSEDRTTYMIFAAVIEALLLTVTCLFALEALLKIIALGMRRYLSSFGNIFDFTLAIIALTEVVAVGTQLTCQINSIRDDRTGLQDIDVCSGEANSWAQALRALRLVRLSRLLRRFPAVRRVGMCFHYVLRESWGALALFVLCATIATLMGFILLGGKIYDLRSPGGSSGSAAFLPEKTDLTHIHEALFVMPRSRVLVHIPSREPKDELPGWPAQADIPPVFSPTRGSYTQYAKELLGLSDKQKVIVNRTNNLVNISVLESFIRQNVIIQTALPLNDGSESDRTHIAAMVPDRINFETMTEALISVSQLAVGTGWAPIYARVRLAAGYVGDAYVLAFLFISRAVLASLFTALFYVHLAAMTAKLKQEEKRKEEEARMQLKFLKIVGLWTIYYQDGTTEIPQASEEHLSLKEQIKRKTQVNTKLVRITHQDDRRVEFFSRYASANGH